MKFAGILCPGEGPLPCSGNGQCDFTIGQCTCNIGHQGSDCSGKISNNGHSFHCKNYVLAKIQFFLYVFASVLCNCCNQQRVYEHSFKDPIIQNLA